MKELLTQDFELTISGVGFKFRKVFPESSDRPYRVRIDGLDFNLPATITQDFIDGLVTGVKVATAVAEKNNERKGESGTN